MIQGRTYLGKPGLTSLSHPSLIAVRILGVWREGMAFNKIALTTPGWPEFAYAGAFGAIIFDPTVPFLGTPADGIREKIFVLFDS
jgi:hypothetical protein